MSVCVCTRDILYLGGVLVLVSISCIAVVCCATEQLEKSKWKRLSLSLDLTCLTVQLVSCSTWSPWCAFVASFFSVFPTHHLPFHISALRMVSHSNAKRSIQLLWPEARHTPTMSIHGTSVSSLLLPPPLPVQLPPRLAGPMSCCKPYLLYLRYETTSTSPLATTSLEHTQARPSLRYAVPSLILARALCLCLSSLHLMLPCPFLHRLLSPRPGLASPILALALWCCLLACGCTCACGGSHQPKPAGYFLTSACACASARRDLRSWSSRQLI